MTGRKYAHGRPAPSLAPDRDEGPRPACVGRWDVYDALIDGNVTDVRFVRPAAVAMCTSCPIRLACWTMNADEEWLHNLLKPRVHGNRKKVPA